MIRMLLIVGFGGTIGCIFRLLLLTCMRPICSAFPYDILLINILGSFFIGLLPTLFFNFFSLSPLMYAMIITGLLGGFTTFSSFSLSVIILIQQGALFSALIYIFASVFLSIIATWLGIIIAK